MGEKKGEIYVHFVDLFLFRDLFLFFSLLLVVFQTRICRVQHALREGEPLCATDFTLWREREREREGEEEEVERGEGVRRWMKRER